MGRLLPIYRYSEKIQFMRNQFSEKITFFQEYLKHIHEVSSILPTSSSVGDALVAEAAQFANPKRVLEVGAGTGAITVRIAPHIGPQDHFSICEINTAFMQSLRSRFEQEPQLHSILPHTTFFQGSILDFKPAEPFDFIICTLPFNMLPPDFIDAVFHYFQTILNPGGVVSYIEYVGGRTLKALTNMDPAQHARLAVLARHVSHNTFRRETVIRNFPPTWIHHLRFADAPAEIVLAIDEQ